MNNIFVKIILFLVLAGFTAGTARYCERYYEYGPQLLKNNEFVEGFRHWQIRGPAGAVTSDTAGMLQLTSHDAGTNVQIFQTLAAPKDSAMIRLSGLLSCQEVKAGRISWHMARLILNSLDKQGKWVPGFNVSTYLSGTTEWQHAEHTIAVSEQTAEVRLAAQLNQTEGSLFVKNLSLRAVQEHAWYPWLKWSIITAWAIFLVAVFYPYLAGRQGIVLSLLLVILIGAIIGGTAAPGKLIGSWQTAISRTLHITKDSPPSAIADNTITTAKHLPGVKITKVAHFFLFLLLTILCYFLMGRHNLLFLCTDIMLLAGATELIQLYVNNRGPAFADIGIDCAGALAGLFFCRFVFKGVTV